MSLRFAFLRIRLFFGVRMLGARWNRGVFWYELLEFLLQAGDSLIQFRKATFIVVDQIVKKLTGFWR